MFDQVKCQFNIPEAKQIIGKSEYYKDAHIKTNKQPIPIFNDEFNDIDDLESPEGVLDSSLVLGVNSSVNQTDMTTGKKGRKRRQRRRKNKNKNKIDINDPLNQEKTLQQIYCIENGIQYIQNNCKFDPNININFGQNLGIISKQQEFFQFNQIQLSHIKKKINNFWEDNQQQEINDMNYSIENQLEQNQNHILKEQVSIEQNPFKTSQQSDSFNQHSKQQQNFQSNDRDQQLLNIPKVIIDEMRKVQSTNKNENNEIEEVQDHWETNYDDEDCCSMQNDLMISEEEDEQEQDEYEQEYDDVDDEYLDEDYEETEDHNDILDEQNLDFEE